MKRIAYVLHRFPGIADTFIKREIRSLQGFGTDVQVISIWKPSEPETTAAILSRWSADTHFILPQSAFSVVNTLIKSLMRSPGRFLATFQLSIKTSRPGVQGFIYQLFYF